MGVAEHPDRWAIEWGGGYLTGKWVSLHNPNSGQSANGRHWTDWDEAYEAAALVADQQGDLVTEVETFLESE